MALIEPQSRRRELVAAVRAELKDLIDAVGQADGNMFTRGGRDALKRMQRINALLRMIEEERT
jgi:hypothetical protein